MKGDRSKKKTGKLALIEDVTSDVKVDKQETNYKGSARRYPNLQRGPKHTTKAIHVSDPKLIGRYHHDIYGKNLVMDGNDGVRVYNLPIEEMENKKTENLDEDYVVDDWEQLVEDTSSLQISQSDIFIPDCYGLNFNLLKGYIPISDGGNSVSMAEIQNRDRTAGMRWLVENYQKVKCEDGTRLFDVDFFVGNGAVRKIMTLNFTPFGEGTQIAAILFKGTYFVYDVTVKDDRSELNNKRSFSGLRFEDFLSRGINGEENGPSSGERNNYNDAIKHYNVLKFTFGNFKMILTGEVDCVLPGSSAALGKKPKADDFIEIKTSAPLEDKFDQTRMSHIFRCGKISSWFAQCSLMGMKHVVVGIRNEIGNEMTCERTYAFTIDELRQHSNGSWSKNRCFDKLQKFLHKVKETVVEDNPDIYNIFTFKDGLISGPEMKTRSNDENLPDIREVVQLMENLEQNNNICLETKN